MAVTYVYPTDPWFSGFSIREVFIAQGAGAKRSTDAASVSTWTRLPGIINVNLTPGAKTVEQYGDDGLQNLWLYDARMTLELDTSMMAADLIALINGVSASVISGSANAVYFGTDLEYQAPHVFVRAEAVCKNEVTSAKNNRQVVRYTFLNSVISNITAPESAAYGKSHEQRYRLECLPAYYDETGTAVSSIVTGATFMIAKAEFGLASFDL